jgi:hypothetical protein
LPLALLLFLGGCSTASTPPGQAVLLTGPEGDIWSAAPPASVSLDLVLDNNTRTSVGQTNAPSASNLTVRLHDPGGLTAGAIGQFVATAVDSSGAPLIGGSTVPFLLNGIDGLALPVFVGRLGTFARPPDVLRIPHQHPALGIVLHAYLLASGGDVIAGTDPTSDDVYDLSTWSTLQSQPAFPRAPRSIVTVGTEVLLIDDAGATWLNLYTSGQDDGVPPTGLTFTDVAGGEVFTASGGHQYLVGATRTTGPDTDKVLRIDNDLTLHALTLNTARTAAAAVVVGDQLFVVGGSADPASSGVEALLSDCGSGTECFRSVPFFPADGTAGAGMAQGLVTSSTATDAGSATQDAGMGPEPAVDLEAAVDPDASGDQEAGAGPDASGDLEAGAGPDASGDLEAGAGPDAGGDLDATADAGIESGAVDAGSVTAAPGMIIAFLAGGSSGGQPGGLRRLDLSCATQAASMSSTPPPCSIRDIAPLPLALARTHAFALKPAELLITGETDDGVNHALTFDLTSLSFGLPALREPRKGASVALLPNGQVGFVGGLSADTGLPVSTIEIFIPQ